MFTFTNWLLLGHVPYVLVGAGTASFAAAKAIRQKDPQAKVLIIGKYINNVYSQTRMYTCTCKNIWRTLSLR